MDRPLSENLRARAEAKFRKKEEQLRDGVKAMADYTAAGVAEQERTVRLRRLREAKEAAEAAQGSSETAKGTRKIEKS